MQALRSLYGTEKLELEDLIETRIDYPVELTYYKIRSTNQYAVEIVKTEYLREGTNVESEKINLFTTNEEKTNHILELLKKNKVTPVGLRDTLEEIVKSGW